MYSDKLENIPGNPLGGTQSLSFCSKYVIIENSEKWSGSFLSRFMDRMEL
jgi:hypothetical protein